MTKLLFPSDGIVKVAIEKGTRARERFSSATAKCSFDIPDNFPNRDYLIGLSGNLAECQSELNDIIAKIESINRNFQNLSDSFDENARNVDVLKIEKRERMIV